MPTGLIDCIVHFFMFYGELLIMVHSDAPLLRYSDAVSYRDAVWYHNSILYHHIVTHHYAIQY